VALGGYANAWPRISVKEISTKFTLQSGQTVAIGGLTDTEESKSVTKIPLLGDIPLIGRYLFSHTRDVKNQIETVVLVTLSLADPTSLQDDAGMPAGARLAPRKIIQTRTEEKEFEKDLQKIKAAAVAAESSGAAVPDPQE
jgi:type II secretory pathway component GspD/PulD (secretin)